MPAIGQEGVEHMTLKPGGSSATLSPWLIQTFEHAVAFLGAEVLNAFEKLGVTVGADFGVAELTLRAAFDAAAELLGHRLHAVADAENRNAGFEHGLAGLVVAFFIGAHVRAGKNDAFGLYSRMNSADTSLG